MTSEKLAHYCAKVLLEEHADDIRILDLRELTDIADFFVIASANSQPHIKAIAEALEEFLDKEDEKPYHTEGTKGLHWILVDTLSIIIHIFLPDVRKFYDIESYWGDAPVTTIEDGK